MNTMPLAGLNQAIKEYQKNWRVLDDTLYGVCRNYPDHTDAASVYAKLWLIGRTYATGIERAIKGSGYMGGSLTALASEMLKNGRQINELFGELGSIAEPLTKEKAQHVVSLLGRFLQLIRKPLRRRISPRSFASKYMHFHCSAVPLFDRNAARKLTKLVHWNDAHEFDLPRGADADYGWFVMRFLRLYEDAKGNASPISVKMLDGYLLA